MNKEHICNKLCKKYNNFTSSILTNAILEFQELFKEKYCSTDTVIERISEVIPNGIVIYDDKNEKIDAICAISSGEIKVGKSILSEKDYFDYVFFHEFIHSISFKIHNNMQFMGFYTIEKGEDYEFKSEAFNEAFTEFITLKRNKMLNYEPENKHLSGYDVGAHKLEIITKIITEEELIDSYFNCPNKLEEIFNKHKMNIDEIFYCFYALEGMENEVNALETKRGLESPQNLFKIIDAERYLYSNLLDSFGEIESNVEFDKKWIILLSELSSKYNFYNIDGIFRYGELCRDIDRLNLEKNDFIDKEISAEKINKYRLLNTIFNTEDKNRILNELYKIYFEDFNKYWELLIDDFAILAYIFLNTIKNNYQLYDIEIYPRVFPYIKKENADINEVDFEKISCEEENIKFYIFNINKNTYVESNYDDTTIHKINGDEFQVKYSDQVGILNIKNGSYEINDKKYMVKKIY